MGDADRADSGIAGLTVRAAAPSDGAIVAAQTLLQALDSENVTLPPDVVERGVTSVLSGAVAAKYFVAEADGAVVGQLMVTYEWSEWRATYTWWIQSLYVRPEHRRKGVFKAMYNYVRDEAKSEGAAGVRLYTNFANTRAQAAYEKLGMESHYKIYEEMFTAY